MNKIMRHNKDPWSGLRQHTSARIACGRAGGSVTTSELLDFRLAHALARDAVHEAFSPELMEQRLAGLNLPVIHVNSAAENYEAYLKRPDLGRQLGGASAESLAHAATKIPAGDLSIIISNGLSARAVHDHAPALLEALVPSLREAGLNIAPLVIAANARVALQDVIGQMLGAQLALMLIGERPGLGSPDSMSAYFVFDPRVGRTDAERNCISNIRGGGLAPERAAQKLSAMIQRALRLKLSGIALKDGDESGTLV